MRRSRSPFLILALVVTLVASALSACAPDAPPSNLRRVSPDDGTGYITPRISADGDVVLYRREADQRKEPVEPRDLVVTRVSTGVTAVFPDVGWIDDVSGDGRYVTYYVSHSPAADPPPAVMRLDTTTGDEVVIAQGSPGESVEGGEMSSDGSTVWITRTTYEGTCFPDGCSRVNIWRNGSIVTDIDAAPLYVGFLSFDSPVLSADGSAVYFHRKQNRDIVRIDVPSGSLTVLPIAFPPLPDLGPYTLESFLNWREFLRPDRTDGSRFRLHSGDQTFLLTAGPATEVPDITGVRSANLRFSAETTEHEIRTDVDLLKYVVTDHDTATDRTVASAESSPPTIYPTFTVDPSVADSGRTAVATWTPGSDGVWPPSIVYVDG